jgi:predicted glycosyltransferase
LNVEEACRRRVAMVLAALERVQPRVLVIELYPFGRKRFAFELDPLLAAAEGLGPRRPVVVCSVRDILVGGRSDQQRHDDRASATLNAHFDAVLVHADLAFARLEESFRPSVPLRVPVFHTGFVLPPARGCRAASPERQPRVIVSAGGGMVGEHLFRAAVEAAGRVHAAAGLRTTVVAGPFLPDPAWDWLRAQPGPGSPVDVMRHVADLAGEIRGSAVTVSQCGYNTAMDLLRCGTPAVVVPYSTDREDEQRCRAARLAVLGVVRHLPAAEMTPQRLAEEVIAAVGDRPAGPRLDLDGRAASARFVAGLAGLVPAAGGPGGAGVHDRGVGEWRGRA